MNKNIYPVTAEGLFSIISSSKFRDNLKELGNPEYVNEKAFAILKEIYSDQFIIGDTGEGQENNVMGSGLWDFGSEHNDGKLSYFLFSLHSHPDGFVVPSIANRGRGDLLGLSNMRRDYLNDYGLDFRPIEGIVSSFDEKLIDVLLIQEKTKFLTSHIILEDYNDIFDDLRYPKPEEIVRILEETGLYNVAHLLINNHKIPKKYLRLLRKFEFTPKVIE
ncbi:MAG TPA: hypothetical protein P5277_00990 [Candidatus Paceibacterota bacterium]|nr:hypothetical protein [Candidatus Paceibacterota bacterium]